MLVGGEVPKMFSARNCMECADLYRKIMFWSIYLHGTGGQVPIFYARNCMKYADITLPHGTGVRNMIFLCRSAHFMQFIAILHLTPPPKRWVRNMIFLCRSAHFLHPLPKNFFWYSTPTPWRWGFKTWFFCAYLHISCNS